MQHRIVLHWSYSTGQFRGALSIRGAHFVFDWYFTKFRGAQKISGEMLVISFVREVNHVIMAATLDRRQNQQIYHFKLCKLSAHSRMLWHRLYIFSWEPSHWLQSSVTRIALHGVIAILKTRHLQLHAFR